MLVAGEWRGVLVGFEEGYGTWVASVFLSDPSETTALINALPHCDVKSEGMLAKVRLLRESSLGPLRPPEGN